MSQVLQDKYKERSRQSISLCLSVRTSKRLNGELREVRVERERGMNILD